MHACMHDCYLFLFFIIKIGTPINAQGPAVVDTVQVNNKRTGPAQESGESRCQTGHEK